MKKAVTSPALDVIQESFEDVSLSYDGRDHPHHVSPRKSRLLRSPSGRHLAPMSPSKENSRQKPSSLTPSQRYRIRLRQRVQDLEKDAAPSTPSEFDFLSDDELPDDLIVYDVPFSKALSDRRRAYRRPQLHPRNHLANLRPWVSASGLLNYTGPHAISDHDQSNSLTSTSSTTSSSRSSPATRASSIFSIGSDASDLNFLNDDNESCLSFEGKLLNSNQDLFLDESLQRISILKSMAHLNLSEFVSKEKSQCINVTRQVNLPPKDSNEANRHIHDYENIVDTQIQEERARMEHYKSRQAHLKQRYEHDCGLWAKICSQYDRLICLPSTRELWWRGIPEKNNYRRIVWRKQLVGTKKFQSAGLGQCLQQAHSLIELACDYKTMTGELNRLQFEKKHSQTTMSNITKVERYSKRIQRCFPDLVVFQLGSTFESVLKVALAYDFFIQGQASNDTASITTESETLPDSIDTERLLNLVCVLIKNLQDESLALHALLDITLKHLPHSLLDAEISDSLEDELQWEKAHPDNYLKDIKDQFDRFLLTSSPNVYNHFVSHDVNTLHLIKTSAANLFTEQLPIDVVERILDIYIFEGDTFLLRCLLALIKKISYKLYGSREEIYRALGSSCLEELNVTPRREGYEYLDVGTPDEFIADVRSILRKRNSV